MAVQSCLNLAISIPTKYMNYLFRLDLHCCLHKRFAYVFVQKTFSVNHPIINTGKPLWSESPPKRYAVKK